jgi:hypothetical protein
MTRRTRWLVGVCGATFLGLLAWFEPTGVIRGWLRGEAFYLGRPTSYWSRELGRWAPVDSGVIFSIHTRGMKIVSDGNGDAELPRQAIHAGLMWHGRYSYARTPGLLDKVAGYFSIELDHPDHPPLLDGDPGAEPVLRELLDDPSETVRAIADHGLRSIREEDR